MSSYDYDDDDSRYHRSVSEAQPVTARSCSFGLTRRNRCALDHVKGTRMTTSAKRPTSNAVKAPDHAELSWSIAAATRASRIFRATSRHPAALLAAPPTVITTIIPPAVPKAPHLDPHTTTTMMIDTPPIPAETVVVAADVTIAMTTQKTLAHRLAIVKSLVSAKS